MKKEIVPEITEEQLKIIDELLAEHIRRISDNYITRVNEEVEREKCS